MTERMRIALLLVVAVLVYANTLANGFTYDDNVYILRNQVVTHPSLAGFLHPLESNNVFRPVYIASFALNWRLAGAQAFGVVRHLAMEKACTIGAGEADAAAGTQVQYPRGLVQGSMLSEHIAVMANDFRSVQLAKGGIQAVMKFVQCR